MVNACLNTFVESLVLNAMSLQLYLSILYIFECLLVCLFVRSKRQNYETD